MKAVVDTNVVFSALWTPNSNPDQILQLHWQRAFDTVITYDLEQELQDVLTRQRILQKMGWTEREAFRFIAVYIRACVRAQPTYSIGVLRDDSDNRLLEAAVASEADFIVSGDRPVLALGTFGNTQIVTPAQFLQKIPGNQRS